ncbi:hypothetical protein AAMO2058_000882400 [Amorphochlora amoebiformis]
MVAWSISRWSKLGQDRFCLAIAAVIVSLSAMKIAIRASDPLVAVENLPYILGLIGGAVVILSTVPAPWVQATYSVDGAPKCVESEADLSMSSVPLNQFRLVGTHNSVHVAGLFSIFVPYWQYTHLPLVHQLNFGIRHIEIDLWFNKTLGIWEVFHECIDKLTVTPLLFSDVLSQIMTWSKSNQNHFPLTFNLDIKGAYIAGTSYMTPWLLGRGFYGDKRDRYIFEMLEREVLAVWAIPKLVTPATIKTGTKSKCLRDALANHGWPTVQECRGKTLFQLNLNEDRSSLADVITSTVFFKRGHNFLNPEPDAAWFETNDPDLAQSLSSKGLMIRALDVHAKDAAKLRGVQFVATNHPSRYPMGVISRLQDLKSNLSPPLNPSSFESTHTGDIRLQQLDSSGAERGEPRGRGTGLTMADERPDYSLFQVKVEG